MINPFMFNSFVQGVWTTNQTSSFVTILESGRSFSSILNGQVSRAIVDRPKTTGAWFFATELVSGGGLFSDYAIGISTASPQLSVTTSRDYPAYNQYAYGKYINSKKFINNTMTVYGTLIGLGGIVGISYNADTGDVRGYRYISESWVDDGLMTTITVGTACVPIGYLRALALNNQFLRLRSDLGTPSGFTLWA